MVLSSMQPSVKNVFKMMCFDRLFHCVDSPGEAPGFSETEQTEPPFPKVLHCPNCGKLLKAKKAGRYRCPGCARVLRVEPTASAALERSRS